MMFCNKSTIKQNRLKDMEWWATTNNVRNKRLLILYAEQNFEVSNSTARNYANIVFARLYRLEQTAKGLQELWNMVTGGR